MTTIHRAVSGSALRTGAVLLLALVVMGCPGPGDVPNGAQFKFTADGTGTPNAAPLDPLRDGTYRGGLLVDGTVDLKTGRARRVIEQATGQVTYVIDSKIGLFMAGGQVDGILENPVLLVPATVRVGMKWEVTLKDDEVPAYTFEVVSRTEAAPSVFGKTTQWSIAQKGVKGAVTNRVYAEGIGIAGISTELNLIPLESPDPEPSKAPKVALEPMPISGGVDYPGAATGTSVSMVRAAGHDAVLMYDVEAENGVAAVCLKVTASSAVPITPIGGSPYKRLGPEECQTASKVGTNNVALQLGGHASGAFVEADGHVSWIPRKRGHLVESGLNFVDSNNSTLLARALLPGDAGTARFLFEQGLNDVVKLGGTDYLYGHQTDPELQLPDSFLSLTGVVFVSPLTTDEGDRGSLLVRTGDEMLWLVQVSSAGMTAPVQLGRLGGTLSVQATEAGHEILRVTPDGQIDRLHLKAGQLTLEPLATVDVPVHMYADGAFLSREPAGDRLLVAMFDLRVEPTGLFKLFRSVSAVAASATRTALPPRISMIAAGGVDDQMICLPPGAEAIPTAGWTLGDAPALALQVTPGARCVLLVRGASPTSPGENLAYATATGTLPGIGRVALDGDRAGGPANAFAGGVPHLLAPLKGGTVAHPSRKYGRGLVVLGPVSLATLTNSATYGYLLDMWFTRPFIDLRGDGLWGMRKSFAPDGYDVVRFGADFFHRTYTGGAVEFRGVSEKGGILVSLQDGPGQASHWIRQLSGATNVDLPPPPTGGAYAIELSDGTLCGDLWDPTVDMVWKNFCVAPGGAVRMVPAPDSSLLSGALPLADGSLLLVRQSQIYRFDTTSMTSSVYLDGQVWLGVGSEGSVWGVTVSTEGAIALYEMKPTGPRLVTQPGEYKMRVEGLGTAYQLVVDDDVIGVVSKTRDLNMVRIPHPK